MAEEGHYKVTFTAELTVRADTADEAKRRGVQAVAGAVGRDEDEAVRGALIRDVTIAQRNEPESDPEELRKFMSWIPQKG